jgi:hypothetical protein
LSERALGGNVEVVPERIISFRAEHGVQRNKKRGKEES